MAILKKYTNWLYEMAITDEEIKKQNNVLSNIDDYKKNSIYIRDRIIELKDQLINLKEIKFKKFDKDNSKLYTEIDEYDIDIDYIIKELVRIIKKSEESNIYDKYFSLLYPDGQELSFYPEIEIDTKTRNRIHIPIGLPYILKGCGLGKKIYKTLIYELGYLSTNVLDRTMDAIFIWDSLRKDKEIYTFVKEQDVLCISPELNFEKIENLLEDYYKNLKDEYIILDNDFREKYWKEIRKSKKISYLLLKY